MPDSFTIRVRRAPRIREDAFAFTQHDMETIGGTTVTAVIGRLAEGRDKFDAPMPPLKKNYRTAKQRRGRKPIRDWRFSGNMLNSLGVLDVRENHVRVGFRGATPQRKAAINQARAPGMGLSPSDAGKLDDRVDEVHQRNLREAFA